MATTSVNDKLPLLVIAGPTASGKTSLAVKLAKQFDGEIVCADSRTIYKGMDIGTAKPGLDERAGVPHWGLDLVEPGERFTAVDFKAYAEQKIREIRERGRVPFLVGGTGLYIDSVIFDFQFVAELNGALRQDLSSMSIEELQKHCQENNILLPENKQNKRYLIRAIERKGIITMRRDELIDNTYAVGITTKVSELRTRIKLRTEQLFADNVVAEATMLGKKYGWNNEAMTGSIYPLIKKYIDQGASMQELQEWVSFSDRHLVKRQMTWLRRNPYILWGDLVAVEHYLSSQLASLQRL